MIIDPIKLTQSLINCPSITPENAGAIEVVEQALEPMGFKCHRITSNGVENLYAKLGDSDRNIAFAGHTDVVPPGDTDKWSVDPFKAEIVDDILIGRGAVDMKTAIACFIAAISEYLENTTPDHSISLLITGDEEGVATDGTVKILEWMQENNESIDGCIVGEPTNPEALGDMIKIGRRGSVSFNLVVHGTQGHVAYPHLAKNPLNPSITILNMLQSHELDNGTEYFDASNLEVTTIDVGNTADNVIPASVRIMFNIRFNDTHSSDSLIKWVKSICDSICQGGISYELTPRVSGEAFLTKPGELVDLVKSAVSKTSNKEPELSTTGGTSDARFIKNICPVVEYGLINQTAHKIDEQIPIKDIKTLTATYLEILKNY